MVLPFCVLGCPLPSLNLIGSSVCRSDVTLSLKSAMIPAAKRDLFVSWSCGLSALSLLSFLCLIISSSSVRSIFYSSLCIMKLSGNQLIFNSCSNVKGVLQLNNQIKTHRHYIHLCDILYLQEKKRRYLRNGSGMSTSNQLHFSSI